MNLTLTGWKVCWVQIWLEKWWPRITLSCKKIEFQTNRQHSSSWAAAIYAKALNQSSQLASASGPGLASITCPNVYGCGYVPYKCISLLSTYCHSIYHYKRMRLLTRVYGMCSTELYIGVGRWWWLGHIVRARNFCDHAHFEYKPRPFCIYDSIRSEFLGCSNEETYSKSIRTDFVATTVFARSDAALE